MHGRHESQHARVPRATLLVLTAVLVVGTTLVFSQLDRQEAAGSAERAGATSSLSRGSDAVAPSSPTVTTTRTPSEADQSRRAVTAVLSACRLSNLRQQTALSTAAVSLAQWQKHIEAMNLLVAGKISLSVARDFWEQTRVAASENAAAFRTVDGPVRDRPATCSAVDPRWSQAATRGELDALTRCRAALPVRSTVLQLARDGVSQWEHHIHEMELMRAGKVTPAQAAAAWRKSWKAGDRKMRAYEAATREAAATRCTLL
jgi:hypothetical protein